MKRVLSLAVSAFALAAVPAAAQDVVITNATVATGDGSEPIQNASVVVRGGRVVAAGAGVEAPAGMPVIDGTGTWVTPGMFAAATTLGLWDVGAVGSSNDQAAGGSAFSAALDVTRALNPSSQHIAINRAGGVTRASIFSRPSSTIFGGQGAIVDLGADPDMVVKPRAFQMVALGEFGARIAGSSRTATYAELDNAFREARNYAAGRWDGDDAQLTSADAKALGAVLSGEQSLYLAVERASDIRNALKLKTQYSRLKLVLVGASEGWLVANEIAAAGVPVIADPIDNLPESFEELAATQSNVGRMVKAGVKVAIGGLTNGIEQPRNAPQFAGNFVALGKIPGAAGLSWGQALATITSAPAEIAGFGGRFGVLAPGAAGDVVIWDGDPLELSSAPVRVFIDGVEQPRDNHQTRLRERYRNLDESKLPKAYDW
ncbi:amidohydrolase family protein [Parerythrobacter jejuensis]|uniref:Amidohydrolase family protein n=1 Tax=Parerythrobacter jejuensis TaxID=795812 RepID=A0A845AW68_9SPHN|nr:amidohydrolase family protein [Parerythrobacter jejuensis]MXP31048.1 amidohydrolase family protein [Parerythrobacter jejuensis]MXP33808.1 amidohydrolase family protein [Parerythrobacter jejuensis]